MLEAPGPMLVHGKVILGKAQKWKEEFGGLEHTEIYSCVLG